MRDLPLVSIIVPNFNHARYLERRFASIFEQTYPHYEVIILDDCSTDGSREIIQRYAGDKRVQLVMNDANSGSTFIQWRRGAKLAKGNFIWIAESDDDAEPTLLARLVEQFQRHPKAALAYCQSRVMDADGELLFLGQVLTKPLRAHRWNQDFVCEGRYEIARYFLRRMTIPNASAVLSKRDIFLEASEGSEKMRLCGDWWTWGRSLLRGDLVYLSAPLNHFRTHPTSVRSKTKSEIACIEHLQVMEHLCQRTQISTLNRSAALSIALSRIWHCICLNDYKVDPIWYLTLGKHGRNVHASWYIRSRWLLLKRNIKPLDPRGNRARERE